MNKEAQDYSDLNPASVSVPQFDGSSIFEISRTEIAHDSWATTSDRFLLPPSCLWPLLWGFIDFISHVSPFGYHSRFVIGRLSICLRALSLCDMRHVQIVQPYETFEIFWFDSSLQCEMTRKLTTRILITCTFVDGFGIRPRHKPD